MRFIVANPHFWCGNLIVLQVQDLEIVEADQPILQGGVIIEGIPANIQRFDARHGLDLLNATFIHRHAIIGQVDDGVIVGGHVEQQMHQSPRLHPLLGVMQRIVPHPQHSEGSPRGQRAVRGALDRQLTPADLQNL